MAEQEETTDSTRPEFPTGRVKRIMKLDTDINKVNSEALFLVARSAELFLRFLADRSADIAAEKKRKTVKLEDLVTAVKKHRPTSDFLLDSFSAAVDHPPERDPAERNRRRGATEKPVPIGTRRIDEFFRKPASEAPVEADES